MTGAGWAELIGAVHDDVARRRTLVQGRHHLRAQLRALDGDVAIPAEQPAEHEHTDDASRSQSAVNRVMPTAAASSKSGTYTAVYRDS